MKKLLILQNEISSYNVSTYNEISIEYDLTLGFITKDKSSQECLFKKHQFNSSSFGPFTFVKGLRSFCQGFDIVCILPNLRIPSYCAIPFLPHKYRVISWSIGFRCSYEHPYNPERKHVFSDKVFEKILSKCDANIFYMEKSKEFWKGTSLRMDNVFVAPNTTDIAEIEFKPDLKKDFLFVGTLYRGKGLDLLLNAFNQFKQQTVSDIRLIIVGGGEMENDLKAFVREKGLEDTVMFTGPIYDEKLLSSYFQKSLLCFSPTQAGLSVPKSMGYGVPFVTRKDAITGGEIYHITDGVNGITYSEDNDLISIMTDAAANKDKYIRMGEMARDYYLGFATTKHMAKGCLDAIKYVNNKNNKENG